jgi:heme exporter protein C
VKNSWEFVVGGIGLVLFALGAWQGLVVAPPDRFMGDVMRIMYVHVPAAWSTLLAFTFVFICAVGWLWRGTWHWDALLEAGVEVGLVMGCLLCALGMLWGKPTWGVYWTWDPRLTSVAVMLLMFAAVAALRSFVDDPRQRATWAAVASVLAYVNVPIVYFSVRWWNSLHQIQSSPKTVDALMVVPLRLCAFAFFAFTTYYIVRRYRIARLRLDKEMAPCPE